LGVEAAVTATPAETPPAVLVLLAVPAPTGTFNAQWLLEKLAGTAEPRSRTGATVGVLMVEAATPLLRTAGGGTKEVTVSADGAVQPSDTDAAGTSTCPVPTPAVVLCTAVAVDVVAAAATSTAAAAALLCVATSAMGMRNPAFVSRSCVQIRPRAGPPCATASRRASASRGLLK